MSSSHPDLSSLSTVELRHIAENDGDPAKRRAAELVLDSRKPAETPPSDEAALLGHGCRA